MDAAYFSTMGTRILEGRGFNLEESRSPIPVALINEAAANELFAGGDPVGQEIDIAGSVGPEQVPYRIVGVVEDVLYGDPTEGVGSEIYIASGMLPSWIPTLLIRTDGKPADLIPAARAILAEIDPTVAFWQTLTGSELRRRGVADTRLLAGVLGTFALLALLVSAAGLWAVVAQAVAERRREIGVRVALGARSSTVEALVFRQGLFPIAVGAMGGFLLAILLAPRLSDLLFQVGPRDPLVFAGAAGLLMAVAMLATWLPARRAARVDPVEALTGE